MYFAEVFSHVNLSGIWPAILAIVSFLGLGPTIGGWVSDAIRSRQIDVRSNRRKCREALTALELAIDTDDPSAPPMARAGSAGVVDMQARQVCAHCRGRRERRAGDAALDARYADAERMLRTLKRFRAIWPRH